MLNYSVMNSICKLRVWVLSEPETWLQQSSTYTMRTARLVLNMQAKRDEVCL